MKPAFIRLHTFFLASFCAAAGFFSIQAHAGAWLQPQGSGYDAFQAGAFYGNDFFDVDGLRQKQPSFSKVEANYYIEYGATSWLTVGANLFVNRASQSGKKNLGISDSEFFSRMPLFEYDQWVISAQPLIKLPSLYEHSGTPRAGSKSTDGELSILFSRPYHLLSDHDYIDSRIGYRARSNGLSNQIRTDISYTLFLTDDIAVIPAYRTVFSSQLPDAGTFAQDGDQDFNLHRAEIGFSWQFSAHERVLFTAFSHIAGNNAGAGEGFTIGVGRNF